jgi:hypothetical protein
MSQMRLDLLCPHCKVSSEHLVDWTPQSDAAAVRTMCTTCGAIGQSSIELSAFHLAIAKPPSPKAIEAMTEVVRSAVLHAKSRKLLMLPTERVWMLIGVAIGAVTPVRQWLDLDLRVWAIVLVLIAALDILASSIALKAAFPDTPKRGWSISSIMVLANTARSPTHYLIALFAALLTAKSLLLAGFGTGQAIAIYLGRGSFHLYG